MKHNSLHKKSFLLLAVLVAAVMLLTACAPSINFAKNDLGRAENAPVPQANQPAEQKNTSVASPADVLPMTSAEAKEIALDRAGYTEEEIKLIRAELDEDDGIFSYEVEFIADSTEYEYDIDAFSGEVLKEKKEPVRSKNQQPAEKPALKQENKQTSNNNDQTDNKAPVSENFIGKDKAESIALSDAGISADNARIQRTELDRDRGRIAYEVEFTADGMEYDYDIDAETGEILKRRQERDDDRFDDDWFDD